MVIGETILPAIELVSKEFEWSVERILSTLSQVLEADKYYCRKHSFSCLFSLSESIQQQRSFISVEKKNYLRQS